MLSRDPKALHRLRLWPRRALAAVLVLTGLLCAAILVLVYVQAVRPGDLVPTATDLAYVLWGPREPAISPIERLLEANEGPLNASGTMRPAFTDRSDGWHSLTREMTSGELARLHEEREGERLVLLSWIRAGANGDAYARDDFLVAPPLASQSITLDYLVKDAERQEPVQPRRIRIQSLIGDRCATCHSENGKHEAAREHPMESYAQLEAYLVRPTPRPGPSPWFPVLLIGLAGLTVACGCICACTSQPRWARLIFGILPLLGMATVLVTWWLDPGGETAVLIVAAAGLATAVALAIQISGSLIELFKE